MQVDLFVFSLFYVLTCVWLRLQSAPVTSASASQEPLPVSPGPLFLLRVVGQKFSFYSTELSARFLRFVADYDEENAETTPQLVWKFSVDVPNPLAGEGKTKPQHQFQFQAPGDRQLIIKMLDQIVQILRGA